MTVNFEPKVPESVSAERRPRIGEAFRAPHVVWNTTVDGEAVVVHGEVVVVLAVTDDGRWTQLLAPNGQVFRWATKWIVDDWWRL